MLQSGWQRTKAIASPQASAALQLLDVKSCCIDKSAVADGTCAESVLQPPDPSQPATCEIALSTREAEMLESLQTSDSRGMSALTPQTQALSSVMPAVANQLAMPPLAMSSKGKSRALPLAQVSDKQTPSKTAKASIDKPISSKKRKLVQTVLLTPSSIATGTASMQTSPKPKGTCSANRVNKQAKGSGAGAKTALASKQRKISTDKEVSICVKCVHGWGFCT